MICWWWSFNIPFWSYPCLYTQFMRESLDPALWSPQNAKTFEKEGVHYVMALRRDLPMVDLRPHAQYRDYFIYREHAQWWRKDEWEGRVIYHYLDRR